MQTSQEAGETSSRVRVADLFAPPAASYHVPAMKVFRVGPWTVHPHLHELHRGDQQHRVGAKVMAALCCLASEAGGVVRKDDLIQQVWDGDFASDEALSAVIYELRKALGDDARKPRFVETIRKSGFRLVAPVTPASGDLDPSHPSGSEAIPEDLLPSGGGDPKEEIPGSAKKATGKLGSRIGGRLALGALLACLGLLTAFGLFRRPSATAAPEVRSLAVLPVSTYGPEAKELFLAEALTEMLISDLAQSSPLEISSGLSVRSQPRTWNLDRIASELAVDAVLEGSVLRSGERYWISVQLVETGTGRLLWGASYDRRGPDSLAVMRGVALDVARQVEALLPRK